MNAYFLLVLGIILNIVLLLGQKRQVVFGLVRNRQD